MYAFLWFRISFSFLILLHHANRREAVKKNFCALLSEKWSKIATLFQLNWLKVSSKVAKRYEIELTYSQDAGDHQQKKDVFVVRTFSVFTMYTHQKKAPRARRRSQSFKNSTTVSSTKYSAKFDQKKAVRKYLIGLIGYPVQAMCDPFIRYQPSSPAKLELEVWRLLLMPPEP